MSNPSLFEEKVPRIVIGMVEGIVGLKCATFCISSRCRNSDMTVSAPSNNVLGRLSAERIFRVAIAHAHELGPEKYTSFTSILGHFFPLTLLRP